MSGLSRSLAGEIKAVRCALAYYNGDPKSSIALARQALDLVEPSLWIALKCAKTSGPDSCSIKPKPLDSLNHFTVPVVVLDISYFLLIKFKCGPDYNNHKSVWRDSVNVKYEKQDEKLKM